MLPRTTSRQPHHGRRQGPTPRSSPELPAAGLPASSRRPPGALLVAAVRFLAPRPAPPSHWGIEQPLQRSRPPRAPGGPRGLSPCPLPSPPHRRPAHRHHLPLLLPPRPYPPPGQCYPGPPHWTLRGPAAGGGGGMASPPIRRRSVLSTWTWTARTSSPKMMERRWGISLTSSTTIRQR